MKFALTAHAKRTLKRPNRCRKNRRGLKDCHLSAWLDQVGLNWSQTGPLGHLLYTADVCTSSMDLAWDLQDRLLFPEWSSVLVHCQEKGRGQFGRTWSSPPGNLYASLRLPSKQLRSSSLIPFIVAYAVQKLFMDLGLCSEFKWPNDILAGRKKVGGILVEEKSGVLIAGIGINLSKTPVLNGLKSPPSIPATHLKEFGLLLSPHEIWPSIILEIKKQIQTYCSDTRGEQLLKNLEHHLAFMGEKVVFKNQYGKRFPALIAGLSGTGGIRLLTSNGEKIQHSGSIFPVFY